MALIVRGYDPFKELEDMASEVRKNMLQTFSQGASTIAMPIADVFEEDGKFVVHLHVVGLTQEEIEIEADHDYLVVKGHRDQNEEEKEKRKYVLKESSNTVYRRFALPKHADTQNIQAHLSDGVLRIEIPLHIEHKPRRVAVNKK